MNFKTTMWLTLLLAALVGLYFWHQSAPPAPVDSQSLDERPGVALFTASQLPTERVSEISVTKGDQRTVVLSKEIDQWWQTQPVRFALQRWSIQGLIDAAATLRAAEQFTPGGNGQPDLAALGLEPPKATLTLAGQGEQPFTHVIRMGRRLGGRVSVTIDDDPRVHIVSDALAKLVLEDGVRDWRQRSVNGPSDGQVQRVRLTAEGRQIELTKQDGRWRLAGDDRGRADAAAVADLFAGINQLSIREFVEIASDDLTLYGLDAPSRQLDVYSVDLEPAEQTEQTVPTEKRFALRVGALGDLSGETYFATWSVGDQPSPVVFTISKYYAERFDKRVDDLRDPRLTDVQGSDVKRLEVRREDEVAMAVERDTDDWVLADSDGDRVTLDAMAVANLVESVVAARAMAYQSPPSEDQTPVAVIRISAIGREEDLVLNVYAIDPIVEVDAASGDGVDDGAEPPQPEQVEAVAIVSDDCPVAYVLAKSAIQGVFEPVESLYAVVEPSASGPAVAEPAVETKPTDEMTK